MYTALLMVCLLDQSPSPANCTTFYYKQLFESEFVCMDTIVSFLNSPYYTMGYSETHKPYKIDCYKWLDEKDLNPAPSL